MNVQNSSVEETKSLMCKSCKSFYGSETTEWLCSSCYKKNKNTKKEDVKLEKVQPSVQIKELKKEVQVEKKQEDVIKSEEKKQADKKRCFDCNKKIGLLGVECKCGFVYCNSHRLPENHSCNFNYKKEGQGLLQKQIIKCYNGKIVQI